MRVRTEERIKIEHSASRCVPSPSGRTGRIGLGGDEQSGLSPCARSLWWSGRCAKADRLLIALAPRTGLGDAWFFELLILEGQSYDAPDNLPLTALERALPEERDACE